MTHEQMTIKLSTYYREPIRQVISIDEEGHEKTVPNMRVQENHAWLIKNVREESLEAFYKKVVASFTPTSTVPYPLVSHLEDIARSGYVPDRIEKDDMSMERAALEFSKVHDIPKDAAPPRDATCQQVYEFVRAHNHDNNHVIKEYGVFGALKAWSLFKAITEGVVIAGNFRDYKHFTDYKKF